jgi:hypothetical protein
MIRSFVAASFQPDRCRVLPRRNEPARARSWTIPAACDEHATRLEPGVHLRAGKPALRLPTAKPAPGAMDRRVERRPRFGSFHSVEDHRVVPHRAADEAPLAADGGRRALAHDPKIPFPVRFTPGMVVVAVHHPREGVADDPKTCVRIVSSGFE